MTLTPVKDNSLYESPSPVSNGAGEFLYAGETRSFGSRRALLAFDPVAGGVPAGATISNVQLTMTISLSARNSASTQFELHKLTQDWGEGTSDAGRPGGTGAPAAPDDATWMHAFFNTTTWNNEGGDFESTSSATASAGVANTQVIWSSAGLAADVQSWVDDAATNFGWIMIGDETIGPNARRFFSREHFDNPNNRPQLEITFEEAPTESLTLSLADDSISENGGATTATVTRTGSSGELTVQLMSSDASEATVVDSVVIPDGASTSPPISITAVDDALLDGTQTVTITASAAGATDGIGTVEVTDFEQLIVSIQEGAISENGGAATATVTRTDPTGSLTVNLMSDDTSEATVVSSIVISAGETVSPSFSIDAVDDDLLDGTQVVTITASAEGYQSGEDTLDITDSEALTLTIAEDSIFESGGTTTATISRPGSAGQLTVDLMSDDTTEATVVASVMIADGATTSVPIVIDAVDDQLLDGSQIVTITASAAGYESGADSLSVLDFEELTIAIVDSAISENGGSTTATVTRSATSGTLVVDLQSDMTDEATVPPTIEFTDGQNTSEPFTITAVDDALLDGSQTVTVTASAAGYESALGGLEVTDFEQLIVTIALDEIGEGGSTQATVTRTDVTGNLTVALSSSNVDRATVAETVTIPAGAAAANFTVSAVDDAVNDGDQVVTVTAAAIGYVAGSSTVVVQEDDRPVVLTPSKDNTLFESDTGSFSSGEGPSLFIGRNGLGEIRRALIAFDLVNGGIPAGSTILSAALDLAVNRSSSEADTEPASLHRLTQDWGEGPSGAGIEGGGRGSQAEPGDATWIHTFFDAQTWSTPGGDFETAASATADVGIDGTIANWESEQLAADVQSWLNNPGSNFGWILRGNETSISTSKRFDSRERTEGSPPALTVAFKPPDEQLIVSIDSDAFSEAGGVAQGTVTRSGDLSGSISVFLSSDDLTEASVPATVTIPDGAESATFTVTAVDDVLLDGSQSVTISAVATGFAPGTDSLEVTDVETLSVSIDAGSISESGGMTTATVSRPGTVGNVTIDLSSSDLSEAVTVASVVILDGQSESSPFVIDAVDDLLLDGVQTVDVTAAASGFESGSASLEVTDFEELSISIVDPSISENGGVTTATVTRPGLSGTLTIDLLSSDGTEAEVVASIEIPDGQAASAAFDISAIDDALLDGTQTVTITASAAGFETASDMLDVTDFEELSVSLDDSSISEAGGTTTLTVTRTDPTGELVVNLTSNDLSEATVAESVTILDGALTATASVTAEDDAVDDGVQLVSIEASAGGYISGAATLTVTDDEVATISIAASKDNTLFEDAAGMTSNGSGDFLFAGRTNDGAVRRGLVAFDLSSVPAGSIVTDVSLELFVSMAPVDDSHTVSVHRVDADWGEGASDATGSEGKGAVAETGDATWLHRFFDSEPWTNEGGDFQIAPSASVDVGATGALVSWSSSLLVADVQAWIDSPATNFGWILLGDETTNQTARRFDSRNNQTGTPPMLIVTFEDPTETLQLTIDEPAISENGGTSGATLTRTGATDTPLTVTLTSNDTSEASVPESVTFEAGVATVGFTITAMDDNLLDGAQIVSIRTEGAGVAPTEATLEVLDFEPLTLTIDSDSISENGGTVNASVTRPGDVGDLTVTLLSDDPSEATVIASITIAGGAFTSTSFSIDGVDDDVLDGSQTVTITASATGYESDADTVQVTDDEVAAPTTLTVQEGVLSLLGSELDDTLRLRVDGGDLIISDPNNPISIGSEAGVGMHEVSVPLDDISVAIMIELEGGTNSITLDDGINESIASNLTLVGGGDDILFVNGSGLSMNLSQLTGYDLVDIRGNGANTFSLDLASVEQNVDPQTNEFAVLSDLDDTLLLDDGWTVSGTEFRGTFFRVLTQNGVQLFLKGPADWQNPVNQLDVNNDGVISAVGDVLAMINETNNPRVVDLSNQFPEPTQELQPTPFLDVSGDGVLSPVGDILPVINFINLQPGQQGEGERASRGVSTFWLPSPAQPGRAGVQPNRLLAPQAVRGTLADLDAGRLDPTARSDSGRDEWLGAEVPGDEDIDRESYLLALDEVFSLV